ncbi:MAG TPA: M48 family metallopeptidase [Smithellaceae bacterium]|nr:M48 family metallopeptidase [Smithellaceae bacterium]
MNTDRATNFFARQARARRNCRRQLTGFVFAVAVIVLVTTLAIRLAWYLYVGTNAYTSFNADEAYRYQQKISTFTFFDPAFFIFMSMIIVIVILSASIYKMHTLKKGGAAVAKMLGARRIDPGATDPDERRLVNVVEEMAIASGIPVPQIFVLDSEKNINAFAAGLEISDAAVTVTRGALNKLNRDELQGVVAHEFSHILNGDMRLNVQLIGILFGILFLGIAGQKFLSGGRVSMRAGLPAMAAGIFLVIIGHTGSIVGRLMQCAISRQQEFLADASAVQFTRNPAGLAGALKKIGGSAFGSRIGSPEARQASHLFFSESHPASWFSFLNTHPPLITRIRLLDPSFDGRFPKMADEPSVPKPMYTEPFGGTGHYRLPAVSGESSPAADVTSMVGSPLSGHLEESQGILTALPQDVREIAATARGAASIVFALLIGKDARLREQQTAALGRTTILRGEVETVWSLSERLAGLSDRLKLPLLELAMPSLSVMNGMEKRNFLLMLHSLIHADGKINLLELSVHWILEKHLNPSEDLFRTIRKFSYSQVGLDIVVLISALACAGHPSDKEKTQKAFDAGLARIPELAARKPVLSFEENASYAAVNRALQSLTDASFKIKEAVVDACAHCAFEDRAVTFEEGELLRVVALALQCPLPPFIQPPLPDAA